MRKQLQMSLSAIVALQMVGAPMALSQQAPSVAVVAGGGGNASFLTAGQYDINKIEANYTEVLKGIADNNHKIQLMDREYLQNKAKAIGGSLRELTAMKQAFLNLANNAVLTKNVTLDEYLRKVNEINATIDKINIDIQEASVISSDTLPSSTMSVGTATVTSGPASVINMSNAMTGFTAMLNDTIVKLNGAFTDSKVGVLSHKGAFVDIRANALNPDLSRVPKMDEKEIETAMLEIQAKSIISQGTQRLQQTLSDKIVRLVKAYIQEIGTDQFLRPRNGNDYTAMTEAYRSVERAFLLRSYLRKKYGIQIGAIRPKAYPVTILNLEGLAKKDMLLPMKGALDLLVSQTVKNDTDLLSSFNAARQYVEFYDRRLTPTLSDSAKAKREALKDQAIAQDATLKNGTMWDRMRATAGQVYAQAAATFASREEIMAAKPVVLNDEQKNVAYNADDTGIMARASGALTFFTGQTSTVEALLAVMRLVLADIREEVMLSQGDWSQLQSYHNQRFMAGNDQTVRSVKAICGADNTLSSAAREAAKSFTNGVVSCQSAPGGLVGSQMTTGDNIITDFRNMMTSYNTVEMKRAQDVRNLRALVEMSLGAQSQDGDRADDSGLFTR
jgi:hypothetical protein